MNKLFVIFLLLFSLGSQAQEPRGSLGIGFFKACPQNELKDISYDDGWGMNFSYLSREHQLAPRHTFVFGARLDYSEMNHQEFGTIPLNTPIQDLADIEVKNYMFGFFGVARYYFEGPWKVRPFAELLVGLRTFNTQQHLIAQNPGFNPEFEASSVYDRVVFTNRFHYGGSLGINYRMHRYFSLESSVTYTEGETGAVMPLADIERNGDILSFPHQSSPTDMLLIKAGIRIHFHTFAEGGSSSSSSSRSSSPTYSSPNPPRTRDARPPPPKKKKLEVKPSSKPKKIDTSDS